MEQQHIQKTKKQILHEKITKYRHNFRNIFQRKKKKDTAEIIETKNDPAEMIETKKDCAEIIGTKIDAWKWFADFLRKEYKLDTKIINEADKNGKKGDFVFLFDKVIIINTPNSDFSILVTNKRNCNRRYISITYCIGEHIITHESMLEYYITSGSYEKGCNYKTTKNDEAFNNIFGINDFVNCYVANKIIKYIHYCLEPMIFCRYIHNLGFIIMERNDLLNLLPSTSKHEIQELVVFHRACYLDNINFSNLLLSKHDYVSCLDKYNECLKKCNKIPHLCYDYKICFEALYNTFIKITFPIKPIRDIVINYLVFSNNKRF
jgi:hypothetical protein